MPIQTAIDSISNSQGSPFGFKNRIINGAMVIDQRNAGASLTMTAPAYTVDRWQCYVTQSSKGSVQQNAGSVTPPDGFRNYLGFTSSSVYSVVSGDIFTFRHIIEGYNISDLGWGTSNAQPVTLSFWVRSSLTGTFTGAFSNGGQTRSYAFSYTINQANTWEKETITIPGDTTGTWLTDNSRGIDLFFSLGMGSTYTAPSNNSWLAGTYYAGPGGTSVVGTNGATFYITGVQLEKGTQATAFDYRPFGTELQLCQRYYYNLVAAAGSAASTTKVELLYQHPVPMRAAPTLNVVGLMRVEDPAVAGYSQSSATSTLEQANYLSMKPGFGNLSGLTVARPYFIATLAASITASPPTNLCQVSAEL
jgi:hypothetical protein